MAEFGFERQLEGIADKASLHKWVDELPDGAKGIIVIDVTGESDLRAHYRYRDLGEITIAEVLYAIKSYEHFIFDRLSDV